ncbi:pur operon repressor [Convivina praedatoris]|uniref:Pur operon repressor n=1 Tax=Convivina praedatoris TaxID=2880963 RepID=A0ABM9D2B1_9LACO|nr:pur operon repressor [Convivina sp. LMG 32447]CAH1850560.1 Pur operon repressor [Convivina sp. LMG 32447]CAH1850568.1 Pur operon repressor [Convivina sp. LMG 32447]CAH1850642.1 Pur operon repressor [Convivina sp. LMG 32447]
MKTRRSDRLVDMARYLLEHPRQLISLSFFAQRYESAKSSISEDLSIIKRTFDERGTGLLHTVPGAAGGVRFISAMSQAEAQEFVAGLCTMVADATRVLPGGYVYLSDILGRPDILRPAGRLITSQYLDCEIDAVMTAATKGIPLAQSVAEELNVPFVIVRDDAKVTEGPMVSVNYLTGSTKRVEKMALSRRSLKPGARVLIVDDFMKAGGTIQGMQTLVHEFDGTVVGTAVFAEGRSTVRLLDNFTSLLHVETNLANGEPIRVNPGNFEQEIYQ